LARYGKGVVWLLAAIVVGLAGWGSQACLALPQTQSLSDTLSDVSRGVARASEVKQGAGERRVCILEEMHTSVAGQIEIAVVLLRLHDRHALRHIALEGLVGGKEFPSVRWFHSLGNDKVLRDEIAVRLLQSGEINAAEFLSLVYPDVAIHPADDPQLYAVELTEGAKVASLVYLYKIALKSVREEHLPRLMELKRQGKLGDLIEYVISLDEWAKQKHAELKAHKSTVSTKEELAKLREIQKKAESVGAPILPEEKAAMAELMSFYEAAMKRSDVLVKAALDVNASGAGSLVALKVGAAHTREMTPRLDEARVAYGVLTPLSLVAGAEAGDINFASFDRKCRLQSVDWTGNFSGSLLDGRRMAAPVVGETWFKGKSQLYFATALLARMAGSEPFPDPEGKKKIDALDLVRVDWSTMRKEANGDVVFKASVQGAKGQVDIWTRCGVPKNLVTPPESSKPNLEEMLLRSLEEVRKEKGTREEPPITALERITLDVVAKFARSQDALGTVRVSG